MTTMAMRREDRGTGKKTEAGKEPDLDDGYRNPIHSFHDLPVENIKGIIFHSRYVQLLLSLTLIGAILRFYNLGYNSLWLDEASTLNIAVRSIPDIWQATTAGEFNPPLFYWIEHFMLLFGNSEMVLRLVPALLGVLTIPLIYLAGKEFVDRNTGIIAAAAFTFCPFLIYYSQEARAYSLVLFLVTGSMIFYFRALKTNDFGNWALFGILSALAFWAHFYALVIFGALLLYALYEMFPKLKSSLGAVKPLGASCALFGLICLPVILVTVQLFMKRTASAPTYGYLGPDIIITTFEEISGLEIVMYLFLLLFFAGIVQAFMLDKNKGIFLVSITVLTFVISYFFSYTIPMQTRYLIFFAIVFFIGIALSYRLVYARIQSRAVVYGFIAFMVVINTPMLAGSAIRGEYPGWEKEDWRGFAGELRQLTQPGDVVIVVPGYLSQPLDYYYSNTSDRTIEFPAYNATDLMRINAQKTNNTLFYVLTPDIGAANPEGDAVAWLENNTVLLQENTGIYLLMSG